MPAFYGIPKVYKNGISLKAIDYTQKSLHYLVLSKLLLPLTADYCSSLKSEFQILKDLEQLSVPPN